MNKQIYLALMIAMIYMHPKVSAQCPSGNNTFTGVADGNWSNDLNWSEGCKPLSPITGFISIEANCTLSGTVAYTFNTGSTFQIKSGVTFNNSSSGPWVMNGTVIGRGTYIGNTTIVGPIKPGDSAVPVSTTTSSITYDGQTYITRLMPDGKWWMAENLNIGGMITSGNMTNNSTIEKYCYGNNAANCTTYGGLYQWNEMMQYTTVEGTKGICPTGWHLPTTTEWTALTNALPSPDKASRLAGNAGLWTNGALDMSLHFGTSGFMGLPTGGRSTGGSFGNQSDLAYFWSSTERDSSSAWIRFLGYDGTFVYQSNHEKDYGYSVRCVQN